MRKIKTEVLIIGAGLAGLSAAYHLNKNYTIVEKKSRPGGLARTERVGDFLFDYTGHLLHLHNDYTKNLIFDLLKGNLIEKKRNSWIFSNGIFTRYPFQKNTFGLPPRVIQDVILGFINRKEKDVRTFADWIDRHLGEGIARHFMIPYNTKLWTVPPSELSTGWLGDFVPKVTIEQIIEGALLDSKDRVGYNVSFFYPERGGIESLVKAFTEKVDTESMILNTEIINIDYETKKTYASDEIEIEYEYLINTAPLKQFVGMLKPAEKDLKLKSDMLKYISVYNLNFAIKGERFKERDWIYLPESDFVCYRIGFPTNFSPNIAPDGYTTVYTEVSYSDTKPIDKKDIRRAVINDMKHIELIDNEDDIYVEMPLDIEIAYVLYDLHRDDVVNFLKHRLNDIDIFSIGRFGSWEYSAMEDAILQGKDTAEILNEK